MRYFGKRAIKIVLKLSGAALLNLCKVCSSFTASKLSHTSIFFAVQPGTCADAHCIYTRALLRTPTSVARSVTGAPHYTPNAELL